MSWWRRRFLEIFYLFFLKTINNYNIYTCCVYKISQQSGTFKPNITALHHAAVVESGGK